jgi:Zn-dependent protease
MFGQMPRWRLFSINGHPIFLEPLFLLLIAFFVFTGVRTSEQLMTNALWAPVLFISILWHELGHAIAIDRLGFGKSVMILQGFGGVTINTNRSHALPGQSVIISLAGPAFSLSLVLIFGGLLLFADLEGLSHSFAMYMAGANAVWTVFNLLPIFPMDGGNVVLHTIRKFTGNMQRSLRYTAIISLVVLAIVGLALVAFSPGSMFLTIIILLMFGMQNVQILQQTR